MSNFWKSIEGQSVEYDLIMKVYRHILNYASETERASIEFDRFFPTAGFRANVDLYLGNGVAKLGWNGKTAIEIKSYLDSRSLTNVYKAFEKIAKDIDRFILIYHRTSFSSTPTFENISEKFSLIEYDKFVYLSSCSGEPGSDKKDSPAITEIVDDISELPIERDDAVWTETRKNLLTQLRQDIESDSSTLFLGAGVSASANMPGWGKLLQTLLTKYSKEGEPEYLDCDFANVLNSCGDSYLIAARYINKIVGKERAAEIIQKTLYANKKDSSLINAVCKFIKANGITQVITTNYDQLIEQGLKELGMKPYPVTHHGIIPKDVDALIYHVHGSVNDPKYPILDGVPDAPVLSEEDYHALYATGHHWSNTAILHAFQHSHCIFIGLSMTDPNLRRLLEYAYQNTQETPHYAFLCRKPLYQGYYEDDLRNKNHFRVQEKLIASLGIKVIWYELNTGSSNAHHQLEDIISELTKTEGVPK